MQPEPASRAQRVSPKSFAAVIHAYLASPKFETYARSTQRVWRSRLLYAEHPDRLGSLNIKEIRPSLVQAFLDGLESPSAKSVTLTAIKQLERWAILRDLLPRPITIGCEVEKSDSGHLPWTNEQVSIGEQYASAELSRAITLAVNTGQRGSDLVRMRWTDIEEFEEGVRGLEEFAGRPGINVTQQKTGKKIWVPFTAELMATMATWERRPGFILLRSDGRPWKNREALTMAWVTERDSNPQLAPLRNIPFQDGTKHLVFHGLRGTACVRLLRANADTRKISDMIGMSEEMVTRYTRFSEQKVNAMAAVYHLDKNAWGTFSKFGLKKRGLSD